MASWVKSWHQTFRWSCEKTCESIFSDFHVSVEEFHAPCVCWGNLLDLMKPFEKKTSVDEVWNGVPFWIHKVSTQLWPFLFSTISETKWNTLTHWNLCWRKTSMTARTVAFWKHTDNSIVVHWVTHSGPSWQLNRNVEMSPIHQHWLSFLLIVTVTLCSDYIHILHTQI